MKGDHRTYHDGYSICYWRKNTACGQLDEWDSAGFETNGGTPYTTRFVVETSAERDGLISLLGKVFQNGMASQRERVKMVLGIKP